MSWYAYLQLREDVILFRLCIVKPYVRDCKRKLFLSDDFQTEKVNLLSNFWKRIIATVYFFQIYWWLPIFETYYVHVFNCSIMLMFIKHVKIRNHSPFDPLVNNENVGQAAVITYFP